MASGWTLYTSIYVAVTLVYLWYRFILLFLADLKKQRRPSASSLYDNQLLTVIIPFYNEEPKLLARTIRSVLAARGNKQVIVVDDGSTSRQGAAILTKHFGRRVNLIRYENNRGKRFAQYTGEKHAKGEYVITIDSDAYVHREALIELVAPMIENKTIGATTGQAFVLNKNKNALTRMIAARYWSAFNIERKSLSAFGIVTCCSGVLSAYRATVFHRFMPRYINQKFLGEECTYGDDRHLTNLVLMHGYEIVYVEQAKCSTQSPFTLRTFLRQQLRWKKSFLRESLFSLTFAFSHSFLLPLEILFNLFIPFFSIVLRIAVLVAMFLNPMLLLVFVASTVTVAIIRNLFLFFDDKKLALYSIPYAFLHEFILFWLYFVALFTLKEKSWGTR